MRKCRVTCDDLGRERDERNPMHRRGTWRQGTGNTHTQEREHRRRSGNVGDRIFIPIITFVFLAICCTGFCKMLQRVRKERIEHLQAQARATDQPSVYVIPISLSDDDLHRPPRYSTVQFYEPPPSYNELHMKTESPLEPPPAYSESVSASLSHS